MSRGSLTPPGPRRTYSMPSSFRELKATPPIDRESVNQGCIQHVHATDARLRTEAALIAHCTRAIRLRAAGRPVPAELTQAVQYCRDALGL